LTVISILALIAAISEPVFTAAQRSGLRASCQNNIRQIGAASVMYLADWDGRYPWAIARFSRTTGESLSDFPPPQNQIPDLVDVLSAYTGPRSGVWKCPADFGPFSYPVQNDQGQIVNQIFTSAYAFAGSSYAFRSAQIFGRFEDTFHSPADQELAADAGVWHCEYPDPNVGTKIWNALYLDGHVKFVTVFGR